MSNQKILIFRIVLAGWLLGWYIKSIFFGPLLSRVVFDYPIYNAFFPSILLSSHVSLVVFLLPLVTALCFIYSKKILLLVSSLLCLLCAFVLCIHNNTYNDATFVTSFWVALWMVWFAWQDEEHEDFILHFRFLAQAIIGMVFLGGFIGKLSGEYFSGEVFYHIFLEQKGYPIQEIVSKYFDEMQLRQLARVFSHCIIAIELFLAGSFLYPSRFVFIVAPLCMIGFTLTNTWMILSVMSCLIGLCWACLYSYRIYKD